MDSWVWVICLIIIPLIAVFGERRVKGEKDEDFQDWSRRENLPVELQRATLFMSEKKIRCSRPVSLHGTPDQVYRTEDGRLVLVDTKTRRIDRVYKSDTIQLSVYRTILRKMYPEHTVEAYGYIRLVVDNPRHGSRIRYEKTKLMTEDEIVRLVQEYWTIKEGNVEPKCTCSGKICRRWAMK